MARIYRQNGDVKVVRTALGQVAEYDVYRTVNGVEQYVGGGGKREANRIFEAEVRQPEFIPAPTFAVPGEPGWVEPGGPHALDCPRRHGFRTRGENCLRCAEEER